MVNQTAYDEGFNVDVKEQELYFTITSNSVEHAGARNQHKGATIHLIADAVPVEIDKQKRNPVSWYESSSLNLHILYMSLYLT